MDIRTMQECRDIILQKAGWLSSWKVAREKVRCLAALIEFGDFQELPLIFKCLRDDSSLVRNKASEGVQFLWRKNKHINNEESQFKNLIIDREDLDYFRIDFREDTYLILIQIASLNRNGFVREKAVTELGRVRSRENLKFVLFRLGDWVVQVRHAALGAIRAYLHPEYARLLLGELPAIDRLLEVRRTDLAAIQQEIVQFILENTSVEDVRAFNEAVRLRYFRYFFKRNNVDESVASRIFRDSNFLIRLLVVSQASRFEILFQKSTIRLALKDTATLVKMKALEKARQFLPDMLIEVQDLLLDKAYSVREYSRILLKPTGMDFIYFYRQNIESGTLVPGAVMGLCDIGGIEYLGVYKKHVYSAQARISMGCLLAINRFDQHSAIQCALDMLGHKSGVVRRVAIGILAKQPTGESLDCVRKRYIQGDLRIKIASMAVFKRVAGWSVLPDLIESLSDENAVVRNLGWQMLVKWRTDAARLFIQPNMQDLGRARESLERVVLSNKIEKNYWQEELLKQIAFFLR